MFKLGQKPIYTRGLGWSRARIRPKGAALPPAKRARLGISDAQKQALRAFWSNSSPRPTY
jgi:hypothetical protein